MPNVHKRNPRATRLPADLDRLLGVYVDATGESASAVIAEAVRQFLASRGDVIRQAELDRRRD